MNNREYLSNLSNRELAEFLIKASEDYFYDYQETSIPCGDGSCFVGYEGMHHRNKNDIRHVRYMTSDYEYIIDNFEEAVQKEETWLSNHCLLIKA